MTTLIFNFNKKNIELKKNEAEIILFKIKSTFIMQFEIRKVKIADNDSILKRV